MKKYKLTKVMTALVLIAPSIFSFATPVSADSTEPETPDQPENNTNNLDYELANYSHASGTNAIIFSKNSGLVLGETITFSTTLAVDYTLTNLLIGNVENYSYDSQTKTGSFTLTARQPVITANFEKNETTVPETPAETPEEVPAEETPVETPETTTPTEPETTTPTPEEPEKVEENQNPPATPVETPQPESSENTEKEVTTPKTETTTNPTTTTTSQETNLLDFVSPTQSQASHQAIMTEALKYIGVPYVWGGKTPQGFDCSGFTQYVFNNAVGINIGGWTGEQQNIGLHKPISQAQPGDLLFWQDSGAQYSHHVAIYLGNNQYIAAPTFGQTVQISTFSAGFMPNYAISVLGGVTGSSFENEWSSDFTVTKTQTTADFIDAIGEDAREIAQENDLYASVMIAQAILESGSGNSTLSSEPNFNLFGIKGQYQGAAVSMKTLEQSQAGQFYQTTADFRKYPSYKESLLDYADLLKNGLENDADFYQSAWKKDKNSYTDVTAFLQGRYATDQNYSLKLNAIIEAYQLTEYDQPTEEELVETLVTPPKVERTSLKKMMNKFIAVSKRLFQGERDPQTLKLSARIIQKANNQAEIQFKIPTKD